MIAIVADIHANFPAFKAVLDDIRGKGIAEIVCLGDVVGYGPHPIECIDSAIENLSICIAGNHDKAVVQGELDENYYNDFRDHAKKTIGWTRKQLKQLETRDNKRAQRYWEFLGSLPATKIDDKNRILFVHGSPRKPVREYIFPPGYLLYSLDTVKSIFENYMDGIILCLVAHTHIPGVFTEDCSFSTPQQLGYEFTLNSQKAIVNVGSVGQPRNGDNRASYVILNEKRIEFVGVEYDVDKTITDIYSTFGHNMKLAADLAARLEEGR